MIHGGVDSDSELVGIGFRILIELVPSGNLSATVKVAVNSDLVMMGQAGAGPKIGPVPELIGDGDKKLLQCSLVGVFGLGESARNELPGVPIGDGIVFGQGAHRRIHSESRRVMEVEISTAIIRNSGEPVVGRCTVEENQLAVSILLPSA